MLIRRALGSHHRGYPDQLRPFRTPNPVPLGALPREISFV